MRSSIVLPPGPAGRHRWLLRPRPDLPDESIQAFVEVFTRFAALGDAGAFAARDAEAGTLQTRIVNEQRWADRSLELIVDVAYCDPRYARVLRNVVYGMGEMLEGAAVEFHVAPETPGPADRSLKPEVDAAAVLADEFYPQLAVLFEPIVRFEEPPTYRAGRRVRLIAERSLSSALVDDLRHLADTWATVLMTGFPAVEDDLLQGQTMILNIESGQHDEVTFEAQVDRFIAADAAMYSLLNLMLTRASRDTRILEAVAE